MAKRTRPSKSGRTRNLTPAGTAPRSALYRVLMDAFDAERREMRSLLIRRGIQESRRRKALAAKRP